MNSKEHFGIKVLGVSIGLIIIAILSYSLWRIGRMINYKLSYKDMVIETIKENVKSECLLDKKEGAKK